MIGTVEWGMISEGAQIVTYHISLSSDIIEGHLNTEATLNDHTSTLVDSPRYCDFCDTTKTEAKYDGATSMGPWAYMCEQHYSQYGEGLGLGLGQRLILKEVK